MKFAVDQVVREALRDDRKVMTKSSSVDLVTQTDQQVEQLIIQSVKEKFTTHKWEDSSLLQSLLYIVDPKTSSEPILFLFGFYVYITKDLKCVFLGVSQVHWGGVCGCRWALCPHRRSHLDYRPNWWHHQLCSLVRFTVLYHQLQ